MHVVSLVHVASIFIVRINKGISNHSNGNEVSKLPGHFCHSKRAIFHLYAADTDSGQIV